MRATAHTARIGRLTAVFAMTVVALWAVTAIPATAAPAVDGFSTWHGASGSKGSDSSSGGGSYRGDPDCAKRSKADRRWRQRKRACYASTIVAKGQREGRGVYHSIERAIAHTRPGGTVLIRPGRYEESLKITWPVDLRADVRADSIELSDRVVLVPPANDPCITVDLKSRERVSVRDIWLFQAETSRAEACIEHEGGSLVLETSRLVGNGRSSGVMLRGDHAWVEFNEIEGFETGITVGTSNRSRDRDRLDDRDRGYRLFRNMISENDKGISVDANDVPVALDRNIITRNYDAGLVVSKGTVTATQNDVVANRADGIVVVYPENLRLIDNDIRNNRRYGLHMPFGPMADLSRNSVECNAGGGVTPPGEDSDARRAYPGNTIRYNETDEGLDGEERRGFWRRVFHGRHHTDRDREDREEYCSTWAAEYGGDEGADGDGFADDDYSDEGFDESDFGDDDRYGDEG